MRVRLDFPHKPIVKLVDFIVSYDDMALLVKLQHEKPNLPVRYVGEKGRDEFIPVHKLLLDDFRAVRSLNP